jgi:hypothetical protein
MAIPDMSRTLWRKSRYSGSNGNCVEAATRGGVVAVRDNKDPNDQHLKFAPEAWRTFTALLKATAAQGVIPH